MNIEHKLSKLHAKCITCPNFNQNYIKTFLKVAQNLIRDEPPAVVYLMKNGLAEMMEELYQKVMRAVSDGTAGAEAFLDEVMDCVNNIGDLGPAEKIAMVEKFATKLLRIILMDMCSFPTKLELLKTLNNLLEGNAAACRDYLQSCKEIPNLLDGLAALLFTIGDYEFQVCIIEALFRFITKAERPKAASKWFSGHLQLYPELMKVQDQFFETDCRTFLNVLNSSLPQRVVSCPCKSAFIGDYELKKPDDPLYGQFLVDFNLGSQRITLFCNQEPTESQEDGFWETVSIPKEKIRSFKIEESNLKTVQITLTVPGHQIISFGPRDLSNKMVCQFDKRYSVEDWMEVICSREDKEKAVPQTKVSTAINPVAVEKIDDYADEDTAEPESIPESQYSHQSVHNSQRDDKFLHPKDYVTSSQRSVSSTKPHGVRRKMSVPCQLMSTPTRTTVNKSCSPSSMQNPTPATSSDKPTSHKVKMSVTTMPLCKKAMEPNCSKRSKESPQKAKECGGSTPKTPTKKEKIPKKVKTPLIMVPTHPTNDTGRNEIKQVTSGRSTRRSQTSRNGEKSVAEALPDAKPVTRNLSVSPMGKKLRSKADVPCNEMRRQLEQQMEQIKAAVGHGSDIEIVPESQPSTTDFTDSDQTSLDQKKVMLNDLKALLHQDDNFTDYPKMVPKVAESPALSTVTEESCSKFSKTVTTPTNSQKTHLTSIPENNDDNTDEDVLDDNPSPIISPPVENKRQRTCSKNAEATNATDTADIDGDEEEEERREEFASKKHRVTRSKKRSTKASSNETLESDSDCEIVDTKPTRSRRKKTEVGGCKGKEDVGTRSKRRSTRSSPRDYKEIDSDSDTDVPTPTQSQEEKNVKGDKGKDGKSARNKSESKDVVEVVMDSQVSSTQGNNLPTTFKKPLEKKNSGRKTGNANVSKTEALYNEFGFSSDDENSSQKDERLNDSQDEFIARIERISGKKNVPEKAPKFFKARARERMNSSQGDRSKFEFGSNEKETKAKPKPEKKGKGRKPQKPGMNFTNYLEFKKPRDRNSSQSPLSEKGETQTYEFPATTGIKGDKKQKGPHKQETEKDAVVIEYPSDKIKKDPRKGSSSTSEEEPVKSMSTADKTPEVKNGRRSVKKKGTANEDDGDFDDASTSRQRKKKEREAVTRAREDKKSMQKKSKRADDDDEDWEFPSVPPLTSEKNTSRSRSKKDKDCEDWEFPAISSVLVESDTSRNRSRSKKRETEMMSPDVDSSDAFQNNVAKIKKKIKEATPQVEEEVAELSQSQRSRPDYDLASVRDDSSDDEELGGALLHYDSKTEASTLEYRQTDLERKKLCEKKKKDDEPTNDPSKLGKDSQKIKKTLSNERRNNPGKRAMSESEDNDDDNSCTIETAKNIINPKITEGLSNLAKKYNSLLKTTSCDSASRPSGSREKTAAAERRRSRKQVNYKEASESESDIGSLTSFGPKSSSRAGARKFNLFRPDNQALYTPDDQVITKNSKKMNRNVFTDKSDAQSEASWLSSTNRKKQKKPAKTYGQGKKPAKRGKLQPGHSVFFDEGSEKENEPKAKGKRGQKKSVNGKPPEKRQRNGHGKRSKSPECTNPRLYEPNFPTEVVYTPLEPLLIEDDNLASPKHADVFSVRTPRYGKGKQFKPLEMVVTPVTPRSAAKTEDDEISIEEFRSAPLENDVMAMPCPLSSDIIKMRESDSSEEEDVASPEVTETLSGGSQFSHISNIKTPKTQPIREVETDLSDEGPELEFEDLSPLPFEMPKSGPSSSTRQRKRGVKRNHPVSDEEEEEEDDDADEEEEEEDDTTSQASTVNYTQAETVQGSFYQPRKLFKTDDEEDAGLDDVVSSTDSLPLDANGSLQAIPAVIKSFGAEFQKKYSSRKEKLDQFSKNTLKSAHKQVDRFWNHQQTSRQRMVENFTEGVLLELTELEKDIDNLKLAENKSVEFLKSHLNTLQTCRISQEQRIKNLKRKHLNFDGEQRQLETKQTGQQQNVREILRKELQTMQKKILMQSQKEEMMNVKRTLQMMFQ